MRVPRIWAERVRIADTFNYVQARVFSLRRCRCLAEGCKQAVMLGFWDTIA
jgi:hypothetical protein